MTFQIHEREVDGIFILDLAGRLALGHATAIFSNTMSELIGSGKSSLILNLADVPAIDSSGLGMLIMAQTNARDARGVVKLLHVSQRHVQLLVLTRLTTEFEMFNDEQAAIDSFFPDRKRKSFDILEFVQSHADEAPAMGGDQEAPREPDK